MATNQRKTASTARPDGPLDWLRGDVRRAGALQLVRDLVVEAERHGRGAPAQQEAEMGSGLEASCSCGFVVPPFAAGGGMANFTTTCWAPAHCATCRTVVVLNYLSDPAHCGTCGGKVLSTTTHR